MHEGKRAFLAKIMAWPASLLCLEPTLPPIAKGLFAPPQIQPQIPSCLSSPNPDKLCSRPCPMHASVQGQSGSTEFDLENTPKPRNQILIICELALVTPVTSAQGVHSQQDQHVASQPALDPA